MELTDDQVKQFQMLYKATFGQTIDYENAAKLGSNLTDLVEMVYRPITQDELNKHEPKN